jgi:hypothetical protein
MTELHIVAIVVVGMLTALVVVLVIASRLHATVDRYLFREIPLDAAIAGQGAGHKVDEGERQ